jgi:hypothetical protein
MNYSPILPSVAISVALAATTYYTTPVNSESYYIQSGTRLWSEAVTIIKSGLVQPPQFKVTAEHEAAILDGLLASMSNVSEPFFLS